MTVRGKVRGGVIVPEDGAAFEEGADVLIETLPNSDAELDTAYEQLKAKLARASANADGGKFFTPHEVQREIDGLRRGTRTERE